MIAQILPRRGRAIANQHALQLFLFLKRVCFEYYNQKLAIEWFYNAHNPKNITIFVLLQYNSKGKKTSFEAKPHGNSKNKSASFLPTNKSTRDEIKVATQMKPKKALLALNKKQDLWKEQNHVFAHAQEFDFWTGG